MGFEQVTIADPDGVSFQELEQWGSNGTAAGGHFVVNGSPQGGGHEIGRGPGRRRQHRVRRGHFGRQRSALGAAPARQRPAHGWKRFHRDCAVARPRTLAVQNFAGASAGQSIALSTAVEARALGFQRHLEVGSSCQRHAYGLAAVHGEGPHHHRSGHHHRDQFRLRRSGDLPAPSQG